MLAATQTHGAFRFKCLPRQKQTTTETTMKITTEITTETATKIITKTTMKTTMKKLLTILIAVALGGFNAKASAQTNSPAAEWLSRQVDDYSSRVYVYSDFSDSRNAFTQHGYMSGGSVAASVIDEASPAAYSGITSIKATVPIAPGAWSGWTFATGILSQGSIVPRMDWGEQDARQDLSGARKLVLHARAADGQTALVEFKMGAMIGAYPDSSGAQSSGVVSLADQWKTVEIDLRGADLSRIAAGLSFVLNDDNLPKNLVTFYLDEIYYDFGAPRDIPLFLPSYESVPLDQSDSFINSYAYSYDAAMTVLALAYAGKTRQAAQVADALLFAFDNDREFTPAQRGVRNGYASGDPASPPGWYAGAAGKAPYAKLAGTYDNAEDIWKEDYYSDSYSTGNNAWILLAFLKIHHDTRDAKYLDAARRLAAYLHTLRDDVNGGFTGGWEGFDDTQTNATYASTEHNIDLYSAFSQLANTVAPADPAAAARYNADAAHARLFVLAMYNPAEGFFHAGTKQDGATITINDDFHPLDTNTWAIQSLIFHGEPSIDPAKIISYIENNLGDPETGFYKFSDQTTEGYWTEGTYQKIVADLVMGRRETYQQQLAALATRAQPDGSIRATNVQDMLTGLYLGNGQPWLYQPRVSLAATAWKTLAELGVNPLDPDLYDAGLSDYALTITNGSGSGSYAAGAAVTITADAAPSGKVFDHWTTTSGGAFANAHAPTTTFTMPANATTLAAIYKDTGGANNGNNSGGGGGGGGAPSLLYLAAAAALLGARASHKRLLAVFDGSGGPKARFIIAQPIGLGIGNNKTTRAEGPSHDLGVKPWDGPSALDFSRTRNPARWAGLP